MPGLKKKRSELQSIKNQQHKSEKSHYFAHSLGVDEVLVAPDAGIVVVFPLQVDIEVGQMITLRDSKLLPHLVALLFSPLPGADDYY